MVTAVSTFHKIPYVSGWKDCIEMREIACNKLFARGTQNQERESFQFVGLGAKHNSGKPGEILRGTCEKVWLLGPAN
jgi:hypothetical protein